MDILLLSKRGLLLLLLLRQLLRLLLLLQVELLYHIDAFLDVDDVIAINVGGAKGRLD